MSVDTDLATLRGFSGPDLAPGYDAALDRLEAKVATLRKERDAARKQSRESSGMYVRANEQITELLQQQSFMERKLVAQRGDIERLAERVMAAEARCARLQQEYDEARAIITEQHSKLWMVGLDNHEGEPPQSREYSHTQLDRLLDEALAGPDTPADSQEDGWFIPEGDRRCGVVHMDARATCMKRRGHDGPHASGMGHWIDGPWCEYPADSQEDKT